MTTSYKYGFVASDIFAMKKAIKQLCTKNDLMSVLHVLATPGSKQAQIKYNKYKYCTKDHLLFMQTSSPSSCRSIAK